MGWGAVGWEGWGRAGKWQGGDCESETYEGVLFGELIGGLVEDGRQQLTEATPVYSIFSEL